MSSSLKLGFDQIARFTFFLDYPSITWYSSAYVHSFKIWNCRQVLMYLIQILMYLRKVLKSQWIWEKAPEWILHLEDFMECFAKNMFEHFRGGYCK